MQRLIIIIGINIVIFIKSNRMASLAGRLILKTKVFFYLLSPEKTFNDLKSKVNLIKDGQR